MVSGFRPDSGQLIVLSSALAAMLAQGKSPEEIGRMAAFFTLLGDTLALLALQPDQDGSSAPDGGSRLSPPSPQAEK